MPRDGSDTRRRILATAYELFFRKGFTRVSLDDIAEKAGLTKRTLYYHFRSKDELLTASLEFQHEFALAEIQKWGSRLPEDLDAMLDSLFGRIAGWAAKPKWAGSGFTRLVMELADLPGHPARKIASRHKATVERWYTTEFAKRNVGSPAECARQLMLLVEGCVALMLIHGDRRYAGAAANAAKSFIKVRKHK